MCKDTEMYNVIAANRKGYAKSDYPSIKYLYRF